MAKGLKRFTKGAEEKESAEYRMGEIETDTYAKAAHRAGLSAEEAEALTIERGLYPYWLKGSEMTSELDKGAYNAWVAGIRAGVKSIYRTKPAAERKEVSLPKNLNADERAAEVAKPTKPLSSTRKEAIDKLREQAKAGAPKVQEKPRQQRGRGTNQNKSQ